MNIENPKFRKTIWYLFLAILALVIVIFIWAIFETYQFKLDMSEIENKINVQTKANYVYEQLGEYPKINTIEDLNWYEKQLKQAEAKLVEYDKLLKEISKNE